MHPAPVGALRELFRTSNPYLGGQDRGNGLLGTSVAY